MINIGLVLSSVVIARILYLFSTNIASVVAEISQHRKLQKNATKRKKKLNVVITGRAVNEDIVRLLDRLFTSEHIRKVIVVDSRKTNRVSNKVTYYRKKNSLTNLRLIRQTKSDQKKTLNRVFLREIDSDVTLIIDQPVELNKQFVISASNVLKSDHNLAGVVVSAEYQLEQGLIQATNVALNNIHTFISKTFGVNNQSVTSPAVAYRTKLLKGIHLTQAENNNPNTALVRRYLKQEKFGILSSDTVINLAKLKPQISFRIQLHYLTSPVILIGTLYVAAIYQNLALLQIAVAAELLWLALNSSGKTYRLFDKLNFVMLAPLTFIYGYFFIIMDALKSAVPLKKSKTRQKIFKKFAIVK